MLDLIKMSDILEDLREDKEEEKRNSGEKDCRMSFTKLSKEIEDKTKIHISNTALWEYENPPDKDKDEDKDKGKGKKMSIENLWAIADYYHVSTDYLLGLSKLRTSDVEIIDICEYTGLTEKALGVIRKYNISDKKAKQIDKKKYHIVIDDSGKIDILNQLLIHHKVNRSDFGSVINCVKEYLNSVNQEIQNYNKAELLENEEDVPAIARLALKNLKLRNETEPLALWKIQKYMVSLVESLGEEIRKGE